jgi:hypothetical protein
MQKLASITRLPGHRKLSIATAGVIIALVVLDLFTTSQILYFNNTSQIVLFILTAGMGMELDLDSFRIHNVYYQRSEGQI